MDWKTYTSARQLRLERQWTKVLIRNFLQPAGYYLVRERRCHLFSRKDVEAVESTPHFLRARADEARQTYAQFEAQAREAEGLDPSAPIEVPEPKKPGRPGKSLEERVISIVGKPGGAAYSVIYQGVRQRFPDVDALKDALAKLVKSGVIERKKFAAHSYQLVRNEIEKHEDNLGTKFGDEIVPMEIMKFGY